MRTTRIHWHNKLFVFEHKILLLNSTINIPRYEKFPTYYLLSHRFGSKKITSCYSEIFWIGILTCIIYLQGNDGFSKWNRLLHVLSLLLLKELLSCCLFTYLFCQLLPFKKNILTQIKHNILNFEKLWIAIFIWLEYVILQCWCANNYNN